MKRILWPVATLLAVTLAGCGNPGGEPEFDPNDSQMGLKWRTDYDGSHRGDDDDVYAYEQWPTGKRDNQINHLSPDKGAAGTRHCLAREPEWEGNWWLDVTLREELDGEIIEHQRWDIDCIQYWIHIDEEGHMTLHEGRPPDDQPNEIPGFGALGALAVLGAALVAYRRR